VVTARNKNLQEEALMKLSNQEIEALVVGGAVLGGGGGGEAQGGRQRTALALKMGPVEILDIDQLDPGAWLLTVSGVGAISAKRTFWAPAHSVRAVQLMLKHSALPIQGLISCEIGGGGVAHGWLAGAVLGLPVVDAPCNGRAHPTGTMGSMGLTEREDYVSLQAAVGGDPSRGEYIETFVKGQLSTVAKLIRQASVLAGGGVAVARNPVPAAYVKEHGAPGALQQAVEVGKAILASQDKGAEAMAQATAQALGGKIVAQGKVEVKKLDVTGGFGVGRVVVEGDDSTAYELIFWNEYMTLERENERLGTFPDLIATLSLDTGLAVGTGRIEEGQRVAVLHAPKDRLILGAGMKEPRLFKDVERAIGKEVIEYSFGSPS